MNDAVEQPDLDDVAAGWMEAMRRGDFEAAWRQTDRIERPRRLLECRGDFRPGSQHLVWNGTPYAERNVLVRCNHGLGDTLQFIRYVPLMVPHARTVTVLIQPMLLELFEREPQFGTVIDGWSAESPQPYEVEIEIMELAYVFRSTPATLPRKVPYIPAAPVEKYSAQLPRVMDDERLKVGLLWASGAWDKNRSIPMAALSHLRDVSGVRFYSLQQGDEERAWREAAMEIEPLSQHTADIPAAAAAMLKLDLVITVDSMAAHLAGALARPVWVLLQHEADWRWMSDRPDSPWYPTMRLFRQPRAGDWHSLVRNVASALKEWARAR